MIDFNKVTTKSKYYNFHSHTQYCDGHAPMREFVMAAVEQGFSDYGFSPHSTLPIDSPCNIKEENVGKYIAEFRHLKQEFSGKINLYMSMEIDYLDSHWGPSNPYFDNLGLDYRIGSVHFVPLDGSFVDTDGHFDNFKVKMEKYFENDIRYVVETFYRQTLQMIESGGLDIIGHFDKIGQNANYFQPGIEEEAWYDKLVLKVIDAIKESGIYAEINTKSLAEHHRFFPNARYMRLVKKAGIPVLFNSDAHYPTLINAGRMEAMELYNSF